MNNNKNKNKINQKTTLIIMALFALLFIPAGMSAYAEQRPFITTWSITNSDKSLEIPTTGGGYNYTIDWGDGIINTEQTGNAFHTYDSAGNYAVSISGDFPRIYLYNSDSADKLITVDQWGDIKWTSMYRAFYDTDNMNVVATDVPDLSRVTDMRYMFYEADSFNGDISNWDVSSVIMMDSMLVNTPLSTSNYDKLLDNWSKLPTLQNDVSFASSSKYCDAGEIGRSILINTYGWIITDAGKDIIENCGIYSTDAPIITSLIANDPDDLDEIYSINDTISITFDSDTNTPGGMGIQTKTAVNDLYAFTESLGESYTGQWNTADTFVIIITNTTGATPPIINVTTVTPTGITPILSADETSSPSIAESPVLSGNFGTFVPQQELIITSLVADDPDNLDDVYSDGDTITITFNSDTNMPGREGMQTKATVNNLFTFTEHLGKAYSGEWIAPDTYTITIKGIRNAGPPIIDSTTVTPAGITPILSDDGMSEPSNSTSPVLSGDFGLMPEQPPIIILDWILGSFNAIYYDAGNVGIGTDSPNSKLEVTNGYFELDTSSGLPPVQDCDSIDEVGRMKVDSTNSTSNLYVCTPSGWATLTP